MSANRIILPRVVTRRRLNGAILIYVMWILVLISGLALRLSAETRVFTLSQSAEARLLKERMQIESSLQFAVFQIINDRWKDRDFSLNLNRQAIGIRIYNESGFVSIYNFDSSARDKVLHRLNLGKNFFNEIEQAFSEKDAPLRLNSFDELRRFEGFDESVIADLIPLVSVFHQERVNPRNAPEEVLMLLNGVDRFRVQKMINSTDPAERLALREEVLEVLANSTSGKFSRHDSAYFRVHITLGETLHRVFLRFDKRQGSFSVVLSLRSNATREMSVI